MKNTLKFRKATKRDCSDLTILCDAATRGLTSYLWNEDAVVGQSSFDVGRSKILTEKENYIYFENWRVAECNGTVAGAFNTYQLPSVGRVDSSISDVLRSLAELKVLAQGTRYISAIAIFPEFRRNGYASQLLDDAERVARESSDSKLTLMVGSFNTAAIELYQQSGFKEWDRREFIPFTTSDRSGEWLLMCKEIGLK